jgi:hypothetical protein
MLKKSELTIKEEERLDGEYADVFLEKKNYFLLYIGTD